MSSFKMTGGSVKISSGNPLTWSNLTGLPNTLSGYGIGDAASISLATFVQNNSAAWTTVPAFSAIASKPTTLAGYGITDAASTSHTHAFSAITSTPNTLAGYGILSIDASSIAQGTLSANRLPTFNGDILVTSTNSGAASATVVAIQGEPVSTQLPVVGQILQWSGTAWTPGAVPAGGSGGGGVAYYLNYGTLPDSPTSNIASPVYELGRTASTSLSSIETANVSQNSWVTLATFITDHLDPDITSIPAGLWDLNFWASSTATTQSQMTVRYQVYTYGEALSASTLIATSDAYNVYDPSTVAQYVLSCIIPQTSIDANDRIYVVLQAKAAANNKHITLWYNGTRPTHIHTTIPSVGGSGLVKVLNGIFQTPAALLVNTDVASGAEIEQTKISGLVTSLAGKVDSSGSYSDPSWINSLSWSKISAGAPTALSGYGIVDAAPVSLLTFVASNSAVWSSPPPPPPSITYWTSVIETPTTLSGYGITDAASSSLTTVVQNNSAAWAAAPTFSAVTSKPTTLSGYGITDAAASVHSHTISDVTGLQTALDGKQVSGSYATTSYVNSSFVPLSGGTVTGSLSVLGDVTYIDTSVAVTSAMYIDTTSSETALRVTQKGSGDVIRVEDAANPDSTPFIVKTDGLVGIGTADPNQQLTVIGSISAANFYYGDGSNLSNLNIPFSAVTLKPTTLTGYGITDAASKNYPTLNQVVTVSGNQAAVGLMDRTNSSIHYWVADNNKFMHQYSGYGYATQFSVDVSNGSAGSVRSVVQCPWNATIGNLTTTASLSANSVSAVSVVADTYTVTSSTINSQVVTSYILLTSDNGKVITMNNSSASTVVVPSGLGTGFSCTIIQLGTGQVSLSASGITMNSYLSATKIAGQHGGASLIAYSSDVFNLNGSLS